MTSITKEARLSGDQGSVVLVDMYISDCAACGVLFGMTKDLERHRRKDAGTFYCPNGHSLHFSDKEDAEKKAARLAKEKAQLEADRSWYQQRLREEREEHKATHRTLSATKGQLTKARKRAAASLCPVSGCNRQIVQMQRHLETKHPDYHPEP